MKICKQKCDDELCKIVGCLNQPGYRFRHMIEFYDKYHSSAVINSTSTTKDVNTFGEMLRNNAFIEKTGCYSCFDLSAGFTEVDKKSVLGEKLLSKLGYSKALLNNLLKNEKSNDCAVAIHKSFNELYVNCKIYSNNTVFVAWKWDKTGHLIVSDGKRTAENRDCKTDYSWEWTSY
jgi:hypothetical protein